MAGVSFNGLDAEMQRLSRLGQNVDSAAKKAAIAGAKVIADALKDAAPRKTGGLAESVKAQSPKPAEGGGYSCKILPDGTAPNGEPYAKIGNILEYGWSDGSRHYPWFYGTVEKAEDDAKAAAVQAGLNELHKGVT